MNARDDYEGQDNSPMPSGEGTREWHAPDPIVPGKWYREHTAYQLRLEHDRRGLPWAPSADARALADSLIADDVRREQLASLGTTAEQAANTAREHAGLRASMRGIPDKLGRDAFSPFPTPVRRPAEPEQGTVLGFTKHYSEDGAGYSFAAVRATNRHAGWFLSGPKHTAQPITWDALLDFVGGPTEWARIGVVVEWATLEEL